MLSQRRNTVIHVGLWGVLLSLGSACGEDGGPPIIQSPTALAEGCAPNSQPPPASETPPAPPAEPAPAPVGPTIAGCPAFPADNPWNQRVDDDPIDPRSNQYMAAMNGGSRFLHPDFGGNGEYGIPWTVVDANQPKVPMVFDYENDSDPGPYPIPPSVLIEGGTDQSGDRHILVVDKDNCVLYETFDSWPHGDGWRAGSGAVFNLRSNALRPLFLTSADAAGLPILPGLIRHDEVKAGKIDHALRFTVARTQHGFVHPATHYASPHTDPNLPPMGLRVRLKASYDLSGFGPTAKVVLTAMKEYGMFLADNGSDWFITGENNKAWNDDEIHELSKVPASAFEVVAHGDVTTQWHP
jgi:hypothetical protein